MQREHNCYTNSCNAAWIQGAALFIAQVHMASSDEEVKPPCLLGVCTDTGPVLDHMDEWCTYHTTHNTAAA